jgi:hypothetical protein
MVEPSAAENSKSILSALRPAASSASRILCNKPEIRQRRKRS